MSNLRVFIVEDDFWYAEILQYHLGLNPENEIQIFTTGEDTLKNLHQRPDIITLDYTLPDIDGEEVLRKIKDYNPSIKVVIISGQDNIETAVELLKLGAYDYIVKNNETKDRIWQTVNNLREKIQLEKELENLRTEVEKKYDYNKSILGNSEAIKKVFRLIEKATRTNITVSISGETGTGKELVAKAIHFNSDRSKKKFVPINVTAIPKDLIESELFGHEKGAFTGATARRIGKFEEAAGGTLFLDEIAEMDINMQTKLLRALQEREIVRVGSNHPVKIDVRIIVATHKDLKHEVKEGRFREDLYYRLLGLPIYLPPLRERDHDILILAKSFLENFVKDNNLHPQKLSNPVQKRLLRYSFPGNVRELKAMVELAAVMTDNETIEEEDINIPDDKSEGVSIEKEMTLKEYELQILQLYLQKYDNNVLKVAKILDIGKSTLYRMIKNEKLNKE